MMRTAARRVSVGTVVMTVVMTVVTAMLAGACGGSDDSTESPPEEPTEEPADEPADGPLVTSAESSTATSSPAPTGTAPAETASDDTTSATSEPVASEPATTPPAAPGASGTAIVDVGGDQYEFRVTQCLRDRPSAFGDTIIDLTLDGVPVDTPQELIDPLLGEIDPDVDLIPLVEPVADYGPLLSVSRFEGGGDYVVVYDLGSVEITSDTDPTDPGGRFLDVPDGDSAITISGATTADGVPLTVSATCP